MTLRERIANWILGGELSDLIHDNELIIRNNRENARALARKDEALRQIAAEAKRGKNPNATVRRMGKMAEDAL